ncbi:MAG: HAMP domain-containing histidine kinase [Lachnospiraceae bacterium]|nr:HAMP domain-containing histidine kinase [Lachnospiraceae bacterium]
MVKTLQKKFIFASMIAITILIVILLGTVNVVNIIRLNNHNENLMDMLSGGDRIFMNEDFEGKPEDFNPGDLNSGEFNPGNLNPENSNPEEFNPGGFNPEDSNSKEFDPQDLDSENLNPDELNSEKKATQSNTETDDVDEDDIEADDIEKDGIEEDGIEEDGIEADDIEADDVDEDDIEADDIKADDVDEDDIEADDIEADNANDRYDFNQNRSDNNRKNFRLFDPVLNEDDRLSAVYFVVRLDDNNEVIFSDLSKISTVDEEAASEYAKKVIEEGKEKGKLDDFKYVVSDSPDGHGKTIVFLDIKSESQSILAVAVVSVGIGVLCWISMLLLIIALSKKAIRPIAANIERQKQFITDAGHEIKTPLAIILANTEAMELHNGESKWSKNIRKQTTRLSELMQRMLSLAKMDEGTAKLKFEDLDITKIVNDSVSSFKESAKQKNVTIEKDIEENVICKVDKESVTQLINILTDNAVKYADEDSIINVKLKKHDKHMKLSISNTCSNLPDVPPEKMFDRFYKGDSARTQKSGGFGIGLSVAQAVAESHKGTIKATYPTENTIKFDVEI